MLDIHSVDDLVVCSGDFKEHVGRHIYCFE